MKKAIILSISAILLFCAGGVTGRYVIPVQVKTSATDLHKRDSMVQVLTDSIAHYEAWLADAKTTDQATIQASIDRIQSKYGDLANAEGGIDSLMEMMEDAKAERLPYMVHTRRHINFMRQELEFVKSIH